MPRPVDEQQPAPWWGARGAAVRRTASGLVAAARALGRGRRTRRGAGQPSRQTARVEADSAPSAGYHFRPGRPVRVITWLSSQNSPRPRSAPSSAATTVSAALTRCVPLVLRPSRRRAARRRFRLAAESWAQTERKMARGSRTRDRQGEAHGGRGWRVRRREQGAYAVAEALEGASLVGDLVTCRADVGEQLVGVGEPGRADQPPLVAWQEPLDRGLLAAAGPAGGGDEHLTTGAGVPAARAGLPRRAPVPLGDEHTGEGAWSRTGRCAGGRGCASAGPGLKVICGCRARGPAVVSVEDLPGW